MLINPNCASNSHQKIIWISFMQTWCHSPLFQNLLNFNNFNYSTQFLLKAFRLQIFLLLYQENQNIWAALRAIGCDINLSLLTAAPTTSVASKANVKKASSHYCMHSCMAFSQAGFGRNTFAILSSHTVSTTTIWNFTTLYRNREIHREENQR